MKHLLRWTGEQIEHLSSESAIGKDQSSDIAAKRGNSPTLDRDDGLRTALARIEPAGRDKLRRLLIADHADRDRIAESLLRKRTGAADNLAEIIDHLTLDPDLRRRVVRLLGEIEATG